METKSDNKLDLIPTDNLNDKIEITAFIIITEYCIESTNHSNDKYEKDNELAGVLYNGVQYYDLKNKPFINNSGVAALIELLKSLLNKGITLHFVNVNEKIKEKIKTMGLDKFINCS